MLAVQEEEEEGEEEGSRVTGARTAALEEMVDKAEIANEAGMAAQAAQAVQVVQVAVRLNYAHAAASLWALTLLCWQ